MSRTAAKVLMIGTAPEGKGGVAAVVSGLRQQGLFERHQIRYLASHVEHGVGGKLRAMCSASWQLLGACLGGRPIVHVHSASHASFYRKSLLLALARACGCPTIFHLHGGGFQQFAENEAGLPMRWWIRHTLERSSVVIALSDTWADFLRRYAPRATVQVVPNSVRLPVLATPTREQAGRIVFLGRSNRRKGTYDLLEAVAQLSAAWPQLQLYIAGDGELEQVRRRAAELGIADRVHLLGWIDTAQKDEELARAAIFTLPSHDEGLPMSMLEAMAAQKAIVVTPVGGIPQAVQDQDNGLLVPVADPSALAAALQRLLGDAALRQRLAVRARQTVAERYSSDVVLARIAAIYRQLDRSAGQSTVRP